MILDDLSDWWGLYFNCEQEKKEYNQLTNVINSINNLIEDRNNFYKNEVIR